MTAYRREGKVRNRGFWYAVLSYLCAWLCPDYSLHRNPPKTGKGSRKRAAGIEGAGI